MFNSVAFSLYYVTDGNVESLGSVASFLGNFWEFPTFCKPFCRSSWRVDVFPGVSSAPSGGGGRVRYACHSRAISLLKTHLRLSAVNPARTCGSFIIAASSVLMPNRKPVAGQETASVTSARATGIQGEAGLAAGGGVFRTVISEQTEVKRLLTVLHLKKALP